MDESPHNSPAEALLKAIFEKPEDEDETSLDDEEFATQPPRTKTLCGHKYCGERCMYMPKPGESAALLDTFIQLQAAQPEPSP